MTTNERGLLYLGIGLGVIVSRLLWASHPAWAVLLTGGAAAGVGAWKLWGPR